jgi:hypothetical protein
MTLNMGLKTRQDDNLWYRYYPVIVTRYDYDIMNFHDSGISDADAVVYLNYINKGQGATLGQVTEKLDQRVVLYLHLKDNSRLIDGPGIVKKMFGEDNKYTVYTLEAKLTHVSSDLTMIYFSGEGKGKSAFYKFSHIRSELTSVALGEERLTEFKKKFMHHIYTSVEDGVSLEVKKAIKTIRNEKLGSLLQNLNSNFDIIKIYEFVSMLYLTDIPGVTEKLIPIVNDFNEQTEHLMREVNVIFTDLPDETFIKKKKRVYE